MKKTITMVLAIVMILSSVGFAYAAVSPYTKSPTLQNAPAIKKIEIIPEGNENLQIDIVKSEPDLVQFYTRDAEGKADDKCLVSLKVTPYVNKNTIREIVCKVTDGTSPTGEVSAENRLVYARENPKNGTDGMSADNFRLWREEIAEAAARGASGAADAQAKIKNKDIAIVTVFDVSVWCENPKIHDLSQHHCIHTIRLDFGDDEMSSLLNHYVALMHYNRAGEWDYIPSTLYEDQQTHSNIVEFSIDCNDLSPFAIAAYSSDSEGAPLSPQTGEAFPVWSICLAVICLGLSVFCFIKGRKE